VYLCCACVVVAKLRTFKVFSRKCVRFELRVRRRVWYILRRFWGKFTSHGKFWCQLRCY